MRTRSEQLGETKSLSHIDPAYTVIAKNNVKYMANFFEQTCLRYPNNIAVICGSSQLTYLQLDRRANRVARLLLQEGLKEGQTVGIYMERSVNTYISILSILKAGGAFVPLDPSFPADRVAYIAEDADLQFLLTTSTMHEKTQGLPCHVIELDKSTEILATYPSTDPGIRVSSSALSYIIYTSGTTGRPKGVAIAHSNIANFLRIIPAIYGVKNTDRVYQGMSTAFDFSVEEIWPTWIAGATLVAGPTDSRRLGQGLTEFLIDHKITVLYCVPTLLSTIEQDIPTVHTLLVGGEACPPDLVRRWYTSGRRILNTYGPTETTVTATWCELYPDKPVTIGVPLPTYHVYILSEQELQPVERGESGEICIGGPGVGIGYVNRPDLTESKFIENPIPSERIRAPRLYRSGDLGRFTSSGEIEYLGRIDTQVKIRGYRIELSEIETVIREDEAVENAVVTALMKDGVAQDLAAYITLSKRGANVDLSELRDRIYAVLRQRLPYYMVPSYIEVLDSFPLLAADKVNRKALPEPTSPRLGLKTGSYVAPTTSLESKMAEIWAKVLGQERVSVEADFFVELGGHSLAAARVISQLRKEPNLQGLSIGDLYANATISRLAHFVEANMLGGSSEEPRPPRPEPLRHSNGQVLRCGLGQLVAEYGLSLLLSIPILGLPMALHANNTNTWVLFAVASILFLSILSLLLPLVVGRLLMAGVRPGEYPLWGATYMRWWLYGKIVALSPAGLLTGSPFFSPFLRLLGAKIGKHCHFASGTISMPMFVEIGDDVSIGYGVQVLPYSVSDGRLHIAPIHIGRDTFIGTNSVIEAGAKIGNGVAILEQSLVHADKVIPDNEAWGGSPIKRQESVRNLLTILNKTSDKRPWPFPVLVGFFVGIIFVMLLPTLMVLPSILLVSIVSLRAGLGWGFASTLLAGPLFVFTVCILVLLTKRVILPKVKPDIYPLRSGFGLRKWISDQTMALSLGLTNTLYATLYLVPFLRALGARIGRWSEVSTVGHIDPDMLILGDGSFVADIAVVGTAVFYHGQIALMPVEVGSRSFVGNGAVVPGGFRMGDNSLLGVHSVPSQQIEKDTSWLGSPAIFLPRRQESDQFDDNLTYNPRPSLVAWRLFYEYLRITLPGTIISMTSLAAVVVTVEMALNLSLPALLLLLPLAMIGIGIASTLLVALLKLLIVGKYRKRVEPLWSVFVRRSELITGLYELVAVPALLNMLTGTPWIAPVMRWFGIKIGKRVWMATTFITEFDLVEIGDDAAIGGSTSLQTHLFEDRVMKMSTVKIGKGASIGSRSVVLYDAEVGPDATLDALSLVMKGESLPEGSQWRGIPARAL